MLLENMRDKEIHKDVFRTPYSLATVAILLQSMGDNGQGFSDRMPDYQPGCAIIPGDMKGQGHNNQSEACHSNHILGGDTWKHRGSVTSV